MAYSEVKAKTAHKELMPSASCESRADAEPVLEIMVAKNSRKTITAVSYIFLFKVQFLGCNGLLAVQETTPFSDTFNSSLSSWSLRDLGTNQISFLESASNEVVGIVVLWSLGIMKLLDNHW
jgi:hypothetical protein